MQWIRLPCFGVLGLSLAGCAGTVREIGPTGDYVAVAGALDRFVAAEMHAKKLRACSVALVDGAEVVWSKGYGMADPDRGVPATPWTVYRVGAVSEALTALAIMQKVERGRLDLDAPITRYLPDLEFAGQAEQRCTLRHLLAHHAGIVREPPLGNTFDPAPVTLSEAVRSLRDIPLSFAPGLRPKVSPAGVAVAGRVLEAVTAQEFGALLLSEVIEPAGMVESSFGLDPLRDGGAVGTLWTVGGPERAAPVFAPGIAPAVGLCATVIDLGTFAMQWFDRPPARPLLRRETARAMFAPQFGDERTGLGLRLSALDDEQVVGRSGSLHGFAATLLAMPARGFAVAVADTHDAATGVTERVARYGLRLMLARRRGQQLPVRLPTRPAGERARKAAGWYVRDDLDYRLFAQGDGLWMDPPVGAVHELRAEGDGLVVDDRLAYGPRVQLVDGLALQVDGREASAVSDSGGRRLPPEQGEYLGEYGWEHSVFRVFDRRGQMCVRLGWHEHSPLHPTAPDTFVLPHDGAFAEEAVRFRRAADGGIDGVRIGGVVFPRLNPR